MLVLKPDFPLPEVIRADTWRCLFATEEHTHLLLFGDALPT